MGLLLIWVRLFIRLCNCTQSGDGGWCVRLSQGHPSTGWEPSRTSLIWLSLVYILILAPAWPLYAARKILKRNKKNNNKKNTQFGGGFPPNPPSAPLIVSFPSKATAQDYFNADGKWLSLIRRRIKKMCLSIFTSMCIISKNRLT